jgi:Transmembrane protein 43
VLIPFSIVILFKAELKVLLYLKLKQHPVVKIDLECPNPINNYCLVAAHG